MHQPGLVHGGHRPAQVNPDERRVPRPQNAARRQHAAEREPVDELHPEADDPVMLIHTVHGHDIRMANARKQPAFADDLGRAAGLAQQLQGHAAFQRGVPREVDGPEVAMADLAANLQRSPGRGLPLRDVRGRFTDVEVNGGEIGDDAEIFDVLPLFPGAGAGRGSVRVEAGPVGIRAGDLVQRRIVRHGAPLYAGSPGYGAALWAMERYLRAANPMVSERILALRLEIEREFGTRTAAINRLLGPVLLWSSTLEGRRSRRPPARAAQVRRAARSGGDHRFAESGVPAWDPVLLRLSWSPSRIASAILRLADDVAGSAAGVPRPSARERREREGEGTNPSPFSHLTSVAVTGVTVIAAI